MLENLPGTVAKRAKLYRVPQMIKASSVVLICLAPDLLALLRAPMKHDWRSRRDSVPKCKVCKILSVFTLCVLYFRSAFKIIWCPRGSKLQHWLPPVWSAGHSISDPYSIVLSWKDKVQYFTMNMSAGSNHQIYDSWKCLYMFY